MPSQNTALITGASSGIGRELAKIHARESGNLVLIARSADKLNALKNELEEKHAITAWVFVCDLSAPEAAKNIFQFTKQQGITVDILINNAGFGGHGLFHQRPIEKELAMIQLNIAALTELTHYYLQPMIERQQGKILNLSSTASFLPGPLQGVYYATKAYVTSFTQAVAEEVAQHNVTVTALCPGPVATDFVETANLQGAEVFRNAKSAISVAECGYKAMKQGKLVAFNETGLRFMLEWVVPLLPRKLLLKISRRALEKT